MEGTPEGDPRRSNAATDRTVAFLPSSSLSLTTRSPLTLANHRRGDDALATKALACLSALGRHSMDREALRWLMRLVVRSDSDFTPDHDQATSLLLLVLRFFRWGAPALGRGGHYRADAVAGVLVGMVPRLRRAARHGLAARRP